MPEEWDRYWSESLADAGVTGLRPLRPGSWHVPTCYLVHPTTLEKLLGAIMWDWGGLEALSDPDTVFVLDGGLALRCATEVLVEPTCCSDLGTCPIGGRRRDTGGRSGRCSGSATRGCLSGSKTGGWS
jgi:hypothetical protein